MKKAIIVLVIAMVSVVAHADFLNWTVGSTFQGKSGYNAAKLFYTNSKGSNTQGTYLDLIDPTPGSSAADLSKIDSTSDLGFYIEVYNYDASTGYGEAVATSDYYSYSDLVKTKAITTSALAAASIAYAFNGSGVQATPEPTSGLLLLMGFAMLGLKRKKEV